MYFCVESLKGNYVVIDEELVIIFFMSKRITMMPDFTLNFPTELEISLKLNKFTPRVLIHYTWSATNGIILIYKS